MRLLRVELGRLRSRRAVVVLLVVAVGLTVLLAGSAAYGTRPPDNTERAAAEQLVAAERVRTEAERERCLDSPEEYAGSGATVQDCEFAEPSVDWFLDRPTLSLADESRGRGQLLLVLLAGLGIIVGATFAGADCASGSLATQLLFEPRRSWMWTAKAVATVLAASMTAAVLVVAFWLALHLVALQRGIGTASGGWETIVDTAGRGLALVAAATLGGYALTMLLRSTVATLGLLFAYLVVGEGVIAALPLRKMSQWSVPHNVLAWLEDGTEVYDESLCGPLEPMCSTTYLLPLGQAAAYLGVLLVVAVVASVVAFRRRDVP